MGRSIGMHFAKEGERGLGLPACALYGRGKTAVWGGWPWGVTLRSCNQHCCCFTEHQGTRALTFLPQPAVTGSPPALAIQVPKGSLSCMYPSCQATRMRVTRWVERGARACCIHELAAAPPAGWNTGPQLRTSPAPQ